MNIQPTSLRNLMEELKKLPGIGPKAAERLAFHLIRDGGESVGRLARTLLDLKEKIQCCSVCCSIGETDPCWVCADPKRDQGIICVVEETQDLFSIERTGESKGVYHVLMGSISPLEGIGPESLKIAELLARIEKDPPREVILATNPTMEGEATAAYLAQKLRGKGPKITRIARGLPIGANLEYADEITLMKSFQGRTEL